MSQKDIGNYLGLVPETVSRVLALFQDRQWLSIERHNLTVRNWQRLRETAAGLEGGGPNVATAARSGTQTGYRGPKSSRKEGADAGSVELGPIPQPL